MIFCPNCDLMNSDQDAKDRRRQAQRTFSLTLGAADSENQRLRARQNERDGLAERVSIVRILYDDGTSWQAPTQ